MTKYDIIRFHESSTKKKLVMANVSEEKVQTWCNSPKTMRAGKWFDGYTPSHKTSYECQKGKAMFPSNYSPDDLTK